MKVGLSREPIATPLCAYDIHYQFIVMCLSSSQNENESFTVYWLYISGSNNGTKKFTSL